MNWEPFTVGVLQQLAGWRGRKYIGWSIHNYADVAFHPDGFRARRVIQLLYQHGWQGGTDGNVFITETGTNMRLVGYDPFTGEATSVAEALQLSNNHATYTAMYNTPQAVCWLNHNVNDQAFAAFISGVRKAWNNGTGLPGQARPYYETFRQLGAIGTI
jgi:hypothetical protein